jgi:hypothetical protein
MKSKGVVDIEDGIDGVLKGSTLVMKVARLAAVCPSNYS